MDKPIKRVRVTGSLTLSFSTVVVVGDDFDAELHEPVLSARDIILGDSKISNECVDFQSVAGEGGEHG